MLIEAQRAIANFDIGLATSLKCNRRFRKILGSADLRLPSTSYHLQCWFTLCTTLKINALRVRSFNYHLSAEPKTDEVIGALHLCNTFCKVQELVETTPHIAWEIDLFQETSTTLSVMMNGASNT